jgi:hypothetical protein
MAFTNCCGESPLRFPPSPPASAPPELEEPPLDEPLPDPEEPPLEELLLPDPEEPPLEEPLLPGPGEEPDELPASVVCASPLEELEPQAIAPREAEINPHHSMCRMFTSFGRDEAFAGPGLRGR